MKEFGPKTCANCQHYDAATHECHHSPPIAVLLQSGGVCTFWPLVHPTNWCSAAKPWPDNKNLTDALATDAT